jgi:hypothetical protein
MPPCAAPRAHRETPRPGSRGGGEEAEVESIRGEHERDRDRDDAGGVTDSPAHPDGPRAALGLDRERRERRDVIRAEHAMAEARGEAAQQDEDHGGRTPAASAARYSAASST